MTKILLVEDDKSLREIYGVRLLAEGYDIVSAGDGEEALAMAIKERPTLIISDVMMPKISGFDMLDILRSTTETKAIKVIMMTALSSEEQRQRGESLGADKYLVKSQVGIEDVVRVVHEVLDDQPTATAGNNFASTDYAAPAQTPNPYAVPAPAPAQYAAPAPVSVPSRAPQYDTPRPAGSSERIIQPLPSAQNPIAPPDINALLDRELAAEAANAPAGAPADYSTPAQPAAPQPLAAPSAIPSPEYEMAPEVRQQLTPMPPAPAAPQYGVSSDGNGSSPFRQAQ